LPQVSLKQNLKKKMNKDKFLAAISYEHEVYTHIKGNPKRIFLLLHGYLLDGSYLLRTLRETIPNNSLILAPNGPFPVPVKKKDGFVPKYAWYFFDPLKKNYYINFDPASIFLKDVVEKYNPKKLPVTIIGYSQGGYLAPKVAELILEVDSVVGLACTFRNERFEVRAEVQYHQINSKADLIVDYPQSQEEFTKLKERGNQGQFISLKEAGHKIDECYLKELSTILVS